MPTQTPFQQLCTVAKVKLRPGESFEDFAKRLTSKVNSLTDPEWHSLGDDGPAQAWHNDTMKCFDQYHAAVVEAKKQDADKPDLTGFPFDIDGKKFKGLPELEGYEPPPAPEEAAAEEAPEAEAEAIEEAEEAPSKPAKATKAPAKVAAKKAEPKKVVKPKPKKEAKGAPAKKTEAVDPKRGRKASFEDAGKIKILVKDNPHREGSYRDKNFKKLKSGMTVADAVKAGCPRQQIWSMLSRKIISVSA